MREKIDLNYKRDKIDINSENFWCCENSKGSDIRGGRAGEGHTMSRYPFFSGVGRDGASQRRRGGWTTAVSVSRVEAGQQPVLLLLHPQPVAHHHSAGNAQSPLFLYFCSPLLRIILHRFGAKNPVLQSRFDSLLRCFLWMNGLPN